MRQASSVSYRNFHSWRKMTILQVEILLLFSNYTFVETKLFIQKSTLNLDVTN